MNEPLIAQFRAAKGRLSRKNPVLLLTTIGSRTGRQTTVPLNYSRAGEEFVVVASAGGASRHPAWYGNLVANPEVQVEHEGEVFRARARVAREPERTRLFDAHARTMPFFEGYRRRVRSREIPVVVLERITQNRVGKEGVEPSRRSRGTGS